MKRYILVVGSLNRAAMLRDTLRRAGMQVQVIRTPRGMDPRGCGYSLHFTGDANRVLDVLRRAGLSHGKLFEGRAT